MRPDSVKNDFFKYAHVLVHSNSPLTSTKNTISTKKVQRQLDYKRYQPIWELMHKLRSIMGKRDDKYQLKASIELDEAY